MASKDIAVGQELWIVAAGCAKGENSKAAKDKYFQSLSRLSPSKFSVPDGDQSLVFGSFDNLIRLTDDLQKCDSQLDSIVHRLERQYLELDAKATFKVKSQRQQLSFPEYIQNWEWDDAKYPRSRPIVENLAFLMQIVNKTDDEVRNKTAQLNESKTLKANISKKDTANLQSRDLVDVLTPDVVTMQGLASDDFIYSEHVTTVVVILSRGADVEFLNLYEEFCKNIVPGSAKKFAGLDDKDGNSLWRVVMFKSEVENFKKACREKRFLPRDFEYSAEAYKKLIEQREAADAAVARLSGIVNTLYQSTWSDAMVAWMHIKAMRVFVESVLRFGMPANFASFVIMPRPGTQAALRKSLTDLLGDEATKAQDKMAGAAEAEGEEYFPYVSFTFTPFTVARA